MKKIAGIFLIFTLVFVFLMLSSAQEVLIGDVNLDGKVTATDARAVLRFATQLDKYDDNQKLIADANKDGKVSAVDARVVLRIAARLIESPGVVNIEEQPTNDGRVNTSSVIGMSIKDFRAKFDSVIEVASSSNAKHYRNKDIILICDPEIYKDGSISAFIITSEKYSFNGVGIGDTADRVKMQFSAPWVSAASYSDDKTFENDNLIVTVKIEDNKVTEVTVETKITEDPTTETPTTEAPTTEVPTTESPTTEAPTTEAPTTEKTTAPVILEDGEILIEDAPKEILAIYQGDFGIKGKTTDLNTGEVNNINIYTKNKNARLEMDGYSVNGNDVTIAVIVVNEKKSNKVYLVNSTANKYVYMDALTMKLVGIKAEDLDVNFDLGDKETKKLCVTKITENGTEYDVYASERENPKTQVYMKDGKIAKIKTTTSILTVNEFTHPTDDKLYSVDGLSISNILSLFL